MAENDAPQSPPDEPSIATTAQMGSLDLSPRPEDETPRVGMRARRGEWQPPTVEVLQVSLPQYEIRSLLGRGGMGAVYQGWQKSLDRLVAIKILNKDLENRASDFVDRFKREARAMARIAHPGIVAVHDASATPDGVLYFVMEYVDGTDVQNLLRTQGRLDPERAIGITGQVCDALAYAHRRGVIHRDIKPSNVLIDSEGRVKVTDFGLVKVAAEENTPQLTGTMVIMGTPDFIAPEASAGIGKIDHRADLYAVGVMLYVMLTGQIPRGRFEPPSRCVPGLDSRLDVIVDRAMHREPESRYASADDIRRDLEIVLGRRTPQAASDEPSAASLPEVSRRSLGPLVTKMCDRSAEHEQFLEFFSRHSQQRPGIPQVVFIRGWERERPDSLVARFCGTTLRRHAERIGGLYHGALDERDLVEWPVTDSAEAQYRTLLQLIFDLYDNPTVPAGTAEAARELVRLAKGRRYPLVAFQFQVHLGRWSSALRDSFNHFLAFWDEVSRSPAVGNRTQFLIFVHLVYPDSHRLPGWLAWCIFRPRRIERELVRLLAGRTDDAGAQAAPRTPALLLRELAPVERDDVMQWFKRHRILGDSMKVWQSRCQEIFGHRLRLPMMDVEDALLAIYEQHLAKRSPL